MGSGVYRSAPGGTEGKSFFPTKAQAENVSKMATDRYGTGPYCITSGCIPTSKLSGIEKINPAGEGTDYFIPRSCCPTSTTSSSMARSDVTAGHRVDALIRFSEAERARLLGGVFKPGSRSVMFRFPAAAEHEDGDMFGAVIEEVEERPDGLLLVHLWFWDDLAAIYVTPGERFEVWYVRTSGEGVVLPWPEVLPARSRRG